MISMLILGLLSMNGALGVLPQTAATCVVYPWETVTLHEAGEYAVWVCAPPRVTSSITVAGRQFDLPAADKDNAKEGVLWRQAGSVQLSAGAVEITCGPDLVLIALSKQAAFNPEQALSDLRALPLPQSVRDARAEIVRDTDTVFTMPHYTKESWEAKADLLRIRILLGSGLYPLPEKTPLNAKVFDESVQDGYRVSKVHFEPWPGFLATGNLYRPLGEGPFPGIINPHGHWEHGRLEDGTDRGSVPARCITLARMGAVAFSYDMIGYVDSKQTPHNWGREREKLWGLHPFALQLWTSLRAVDFITSLPYVDAERIDCTKTSGNSTQTFAVTAVEPRIRVTVPVNMISSTIQNDCLCENTPILRLDNSNMEIGAMAAPRPLLMVSATGDWTRETPHVEYPAIRSIYAFYGAEGNVENAHLDYGHNYNQASREAMYRFMGKHLIGGDWTTYTEPAYVKPSDEVLRVFPDDQPPEGYLSGEPFMDMLINQARERRAARLGGLNAGVVTAETFAALLGAELPGVNDLACERIGMEERGGYVLEKWILGRRGAGDRIPALYYRAVDPTPQDAVVLVHGRGKAFLADIENGGPGPLAKALLEKGKAVLLIDAFLLGEHHAPGEARVRPGKAKFSDTFLPTDTGCRVQDILTARAFLAARYDLTGVVDLAGLEQGGLWCVLAGAVDTGFHRVLADMNQFDLHDDTVWEEQYYVPALRALGDLPAAIAAGGVERFQLCNSVENAELAALGVKVSRDFQNAIVSVKSN